jgi:HlyD family secretion protein
MTDKDSIGAPPNPDEKIITQAESAQAAAELQAFKALESRNTKKKRSRRTRIIIAVVLIGVFLFSAYKLITNYFAPKVEVPVVTDTVTRGVYTESISASGNLMAFEQVTITPEVDGTVAELFVSEGDTVTRGQLLFTIDNPQLDQAITMAKRAVDTANLSLRGAQQSRNDAGSDVDRAWADYQAAKKALEDFQQLDLTTIDPDDPRLLQPPTQEAVDLAYRAYLTSQQVLESSKISLESAQMSVADAKRALDEAYQTAEKRNVYSTIDGQVVVMNLERGLKLSTLVTGGKVAMQVADVSRMRLSISINEIDILQVKPGMSAIVYIGALPGYMVEAKVQRVASTSGSSSDYYYGPGGLVTYGVDLVIDNPDPRLKIGMSADAEITTLSFEDVLLVNSMAIQETGTYSYVMVIDQDTGEAKEVTVRVVAMGYPQSVIESDEIHENDVVIVSGSGAGGSGGSGVGGGNSDGGVIVTPMPR